MKYSNNRFLLLTAIFCAVLLVSVAGCGKSAPSDLPQLHPCTVTVKLKGEALAGASVQLLAVKPSKWFAGGIADAQGVVQIQTQAEYPGAETGEYVVTVTKESSDPNWTPNPNKPEDGAPVISFVDVKYANMDTSPLRCTVKEGQNQFDFDVEPPK